MHGKVHSLDVDGERLTGQVLRDLLQSCRYTISFQNASLVSVRGVLTCVAGESRNVWLSTTRHANLQPGLWEILPSYRRFRWGSH